ncbi:MAG: hypothetical protein IKM03_07275 [Alistipes sp.]|nr:hypothetical protein [Alistipes sp.]
MKRFFKSMMVAVAAITAVMTLSSFAYQDDELDAKAILKSAVEEMHKTCPQDIGEGLIMRDVYIASNKMCYDIQAPENVVDVFELTMDTNAAGTKKTMVESMLSGGKEVVFLFLMCVEAGCGIEFRFSEKDSAKSISIALSSNELADVLVSKYSEEELEDIVVELLVQYM